MRAILAWTQGPAVPPEPARGGWGRGREGSSGLLGGSGHGPAACKPVLCCRWNRQPWEAQPLEGLPGLDDGAQEMGASWSRDADESGCSRPPPPDASADLCSSVSGTGRPRVLDVTSLVPQDVLWLARHPAPSSSPLRAWCVAVQQLPGTQGPGQKVGRFSGSRDNPRGGVRVPPGPQPAEACGQWADRELFELSTWGWSCVF